MKGVPNAVNHENMSEIELPMPLCVIQTLRASSNPSPIQILNSVGGGAVEVSEQALQIDLSIPKSQRVQLFERGSAEVMVVSGL